MLTIFKTLVRLTFFLFFKDYQHYHTRPHATLREELMAPELEGIKPMYHFLRLNLATLSPEQLHSYKNLCDPTFHPLLSLPTTIAIGATWHDQPIALAIVTALRTNTADLHSLYVAAAHRHKKVGTQLLQHVEKELASLQFSQIVVTFAEEDPTTPYFLKILAHAKWLPPTLHLLQCYFDYKLFNPKWLTAPPKLPAGFTIFNWQKLTAQEERELRSQEQQWGYPEPVSPFRHSHPIELKTSLGLRFHGKVVGWLITHRVSPEILRYSALFTQSEHQFLGCAINLLSKSINVHIKNKIQWGLFEVNPAQVKPNWMRFVYKRLVPIAQKVKHTLRSGRILTKE